SALPSLAGARSIGDILDRIAALVARAAPGEWIVTMPIGDPPEFEGVPGCLKEGRFPNRWDLDRVAPTWCRGRGRSGSPPMAGESSRADGWPCDRAG